MTTNTTTPLPRRFMRLALAHRAGATANRTYRPPRARRRQQKRKFTPGNKWVRLDDCEQDELGRQHQDIRDRQAADDQLADWEGE